MPLERIDDIEVKRMGMAGVMEITTGGTTFKLEGKVDEVRGVADAFARSRTTA